MKRCYSRFIFYLCSYLEIREHQVILKKICRIQRRSVQILTKKHAFDVIEEQDQNVDVFMS